MGADESIVCALLYQSFISFAPATATYAAPKTDGTQVRNGENIPPQERSPRSIFARSFSQTEHQGTSVSKKHTPARTLGQPSLSSNRCWSYFLLGRGRVVAKVQEAQCSNRFDEERIRRAIGGFEDDVDITVPWSCCSLTRRY